MKTNQDFKNLRTLLTPSWLSGFLAVGFGLIFEGLAIGIAKVGSRSVQNNIFAIHTALSDSNASYSGIASKLSQNGFIVNLPLFIFYAGIGFLIYLIAVEIIKGAAGTYKLGHEMTFVNSSRHKVLYSALVRIMIRIIGLVLSIVLLNVLLRLLLPEGLLAAHTVAHDAGILPVLRVVVWTASLIIGLSLLTCSVRLVALRPRLF